MTQIAALKALSTGHVCFALLLLVFTTSPLLATEPFTLEKPLEPQEKTHTALLIGESLSSGYHVSNSQTWVSGLEKKLQSHLPHWRLENASMPNNTPRQVLRRLDMILESYEPNLILLQLGNNDALRASSVQDITKDYSRLIKKITETNIPIFIVGSSLPEDLGSNYSRRFLAMHEKLALQYKTGLAPDLLKGVLADKSMLHNDGIHANTKGHAYITEQISPLVQGFIQCIEANKDCAHGVPPPEETPDEIIEESSEQQSNANSEKKHSKST